MNLRFSVVLAAIACCATAALAAPPINTACPISGNAFDEPAATLEVDGHTIGFCCPGCMGTFKGWPAERKAEFIQASLKGDPAPDAPPSPEATDAADADAADLGDPYPLMTCPISGNRLEEGGCPDLDVVVKEYDGREVRLCCPPCVEPFEKDVKASLARLDKQVIESQRPWYPLRTCVHCEAPLAAQGAEPVEFIYRNRLFRTCCDGCKAAILAEPAAAWKTLDAAVEQAQREHYPLDACVVGGHTLGEMGDPAVRVIANRLILLCCDGCDDKLKEDAPKFLAELDAAWEKKYGDERPDLTIERIEKKAAAGS